MKLTHLSLCSGIGGIDLAAEWAGFETVAQCEIDNYASRVLAKNFKGVPNLHDIRTVTNKRLAEYGINPAALTVVSAGFPCQPYSLAGKGLGDHDSRDLWGEVARVVKEVRPRWFVGENTPGLFARENQRYFRRVLNDLTALGYSAVWGIWGAYNVGAPHKRERVFILAYSYGKRRETVGKEKRNACRGLEKTTVETPFGASSIRRVFSWGGARYSGEFSDSNGSGQQKRWVQRFSSIQPSQICCPISDTDSVREQQQKRSRKESWGRTCNIYKTLSDLASDELGLFGRKGEVEESTICGSDQRGRTEGNASGEWWQTEPDVGRVAHGIPSRVDRLRCLGNAVVPQQAFPIFQAIAAYEVENG